MRVCGHRPSPPARSLPRPPPTLPHVRCCSPGTTTKTIKLKAPRAAAERLRQQEAAAKGQDAGLPQQQLPSTQQSEQQAAPPLNAIITSVEDAPKAGSSSSSSTSSSPNEQQSDAAAAAPAAAVGTQAAAPVGAAAGSSGSSSTDEDLVEIEKTINVRADQPPMLSALYRVQLVGGGCAKDGRREARSADVASGVARCFCGDAAVSPCNPAPVLFASFLS